MSLPDIDHAGECGGGVGEYVDGGIGGGVKELSCYVIDYSLSVRVCFFR